MANKYINADLQKILERDLKIFEQRELLVNKEFQLFWASRRYGMSDSLLDLLTSVGLRPAQRGTEKHQPNEIELRTANIPALIRQVFLDPS
jgi:hypothetical protein